MKKIKLIVFDKVSRMYVHPDNFLDYEIHRFDNYQEAEQAIFELMIASEWQDLDQIELRFEAVPVVDQGERAKATILAALRYWQREGLMSSGREINETATDGGRFDELHAGEIDELCEKINKGKVTYE